MVKNKKQFRNFLQNYGFLATLLLGILSLATGVSIYTQITKAAISSYNFSGITAPSATHIARTFEVDVEFPTNGAPTIDTLTDTGFNTGNPQIRTGIAGFSETPVDGTVGTVNYGELDSAAYTAISSSDDSRVTTEDPGFGDTVALWAQFQIAETPANITQIDVTVEGYQGGLPTAGRKGWLAIWVPDAPTPYWKTLESFYQVPPNDHNYSGTLTTNLEDYIDATGKLTIIFYNEDQSDSLLVDYVNVDITYSAFVAPPAILTAVADDPNNGDRELSAGDTLTLTFDKGTNAPLVATKADIDGLIHFPTSTDLDAVTYDHILGADYTGVWSTNTFVNDTLTITVVDGTVILANGDLPLTISDTITIKADGTNDLKDDTATSDPSTSFKAISGNWGLRPDDDITYASDSNANAQIHEVALIDEYHYRHAAPYKDRGDLTYVGYVPFATYAIGRRPVDGFIFAGENNQTGTPGALKLGWMDPEKNNSAGQSADGYDPSTPGNPFARGVVGALGASSAEYYRLVYTASGVLYGADNSNQLFRVYDAVQAVPAGTHGAADNLAGSPICTIQADAGDPAPLQLTTNGSADFAFDSDSKLYLISHDILYWVETGPLVGGIITGPCTAHAIDDTTLSNISGLAYTKGGQLHISTFLPTTRQLSTVDPENAVPSNTANFTPDQDIYDLGSVPKWTDIEIIKSDGGVDFTPGANGTYTLTVSNDADVLDPNLSDASGPIVVTDTLPAGLTFVSAVGAGWTCDSVGQYFECVNPNNLAKGASLPVITVTVFVQDNAVDPNPPYEAPEPAVMNTACVDSTTFEQFDTEDCDMEPTPVGLPELAITKAPSDNIVNPGQVGLVYTLRLRNNRTITGTGITVNDPINDPPLDAYLENLRNVTATNCGRSAEATIKIKGTALKSGENPAAADIVIDGTTISVDIPDGADNSVIADAIVSAVNTDGTHHAYADDNVVTVYHGTPGTASNGGTIDMSALEIVVDAVDITDADTEMLTTVFAFATDTTNSSTATEVIIDDVAVAPYGRSAQECVIEYTVDVKSGVSGGSTIHNQADATAPTEGGSAVSATADVLVSDSPIMDPVKVDDDVDNVVFPLQTVTYTLTIDNIGNLDGTSIDVDDTLDSNLENLSVISLTNCGGVYADASTANPPVLNINDVEITTALDCEIVFTADVKATTIAGTIIPNTADVSAPAEGGFATQASSDDLVVGGSPALVGTKVHNKGSKIPPNEVDPGELVTYTLTVDNVGDVDGTGIAIDDTLDANFENLNVVSLTNCGAYADASTANPPVLDINNVGITTGLNCVIVFEVTVKATALPGAVIPNTASASAAVEGGPGDPDIPSVDLYVPGTVDILTTKVDNDADNIVNPGQTVTYTLTLDNTGDVKLTGIHATDTMDSDLENLNVVSITNCGSNYFDQSSANPPELDIRGAGGDPNKGLEVSVATDCVITFTARVKASTPGHSLIPNVATVTESQEGSPVTNPASDVLEVSMPSVSATKVDDDADNIVSRGQVVTYTVTLSNTNVDSIGNPTTGTRHATGVDIYDAMDSDLENLNVVSKVGCGGAHVDSSSANPPILDVDDLDITPGIDCVITLTATVKNSSPGGTTIPNTVLYSASNEGAIGGAANSDVLTIPVVCGNGILEAGESCDDGNTTPGDGCSATCTPETNQSCGNGILESGESCDDGNIISGDGCSSSCQPERGGCTGNCYYIPTPSSCLIYDPNRPLEFSDVDPESGAVDYILTLKNSKIKKEGDYILSGNDNHSTGKQQTHFQSGLWNYQPERFVRRMEAVKAVLVSNCIPIEDKIPVPEDGFIYRDVPYDVDPGNELMHFTARVFYTAYKWGVVTKNEEGLAYPFRDVTLAEMLAMSLRASRSIGKPYSDIQTPWYGKYYQYAKDKGILWGIPKDPDAKLRRDDFAEIVFRIMWYNAREKVYIYARDFDLLKDWNRNWKRWPDPEPYKREGYEDKEEDELEKIPAELIPEITIFEEDLRPAASPESCLVYDSKRSLNFTDVPENHWAYPYVQILRNTKIKASGDYIASGHGNPSTGNQNSKYRVGEWEYRPYEFVSFFELIKVVLISNCIPIQEIIIPPEDNFEFRQLPRNLSPEDPFQYFAARVMYTAYQNDIVKGDIYPFIPVSRFQALAILSRASEIVPSDYQPKPLPFKDTSDTAWYAPVISYLYENNLIKGFDDGTFRGNESLKRDEMAKFVTLFMKLNQKKEVQDYGKWVTDFYKINL